MKMNILKYLASIACAILAKYFKIFGKYSMRYTCIIRIL